MKIVWANFLHLYQPPFQNPLLVKEIDKESYQFIISFLKKNPKTKISINLTGSLLELLVECGFKKTILEFKKLVKAGQIELLGTAMYHPILPLLPTEEIIHQINLNKKILTKHFGKLFKPSGFYCPEMAYSQRVGKIVKDLGYQWLILDDIHNPHNDRLRKSHVDEKTGLKIVFRNRQHSKAYPFDAVSDMLKKKYATDQYVITATDGEMYGHHHKDEVDSTNQVLKNKNIETIFVSEMITRLPAGKKMSLRETTWETLNEELDDNPFPLWKDPKNTLHQMLWQLAEVAMRANKKYNSDKKNFWARKHLDQGLASCTWWWASSRQPDVFSPITWNPDEIEKGMNNLIRSIRSLDKAPENVKIKAEALYAKLYQKVWQKHWKK